MNLDLCCIKFLYFPCFRFAFIDFHSANDAKKALIAKNYALLGGRKIRLELKLASNKQEKPEEKKKSKWKRTKKRGFGKGRQY